MGRAGVLALGSAATAFGCTSDSVPVYGVPIVPITATGGRAPAFPSSGAGAQGIAGMPANVGGSTGFGGAGTTGGSSTVDASAPDEPLGDGGLEDGDGGPVGVDPLRPPPVGALDIALSGEECPWPNASVTVPEDQSLLILTSAGAPKRVAVESCSVIGDSSRGYAVGGHIDDGTHALTLSTRTAVTQSSGTVDVTYHDGEDLPAEGLRNLDPCSARVLEVIEDGGAVFLEFTCSELASPLDPSRSCSTSARIILENCAK